MVSEAYMVVNRRGNLRFAKRLPTLRNGELMVKLRVNIDPAIFTAMTPEAVMNLNGLTLRDGIEVTVGQMEPRYFHDNIGVFTPPADVIDVIAPRRRHPDPAQSE